MDWVSALSYTKTELSVLDSLDGAGLSSPCALLS